MRLTFMLEFMALADSVILSRYGRQRASRRAGDASEIFGDFRLLMKPARSFAARFLVSHALLLRTAHHYVKSSMLWHTDGFAEEAVAALLFALEGCLRMVQEVAGGRDDKLDRRLLRQEFSQRFAHGDGLYDTIEEAMGWGGIRAQLVHPHLAWTEGWKPMLEPDDYYDYDRLVRALMTQLVTGTTFEEYTYDWLPPSN